MCIVAIAWQIFDELPLILLSNRDEFLDRPTLPAHQWQDMPIFAGRDELGGGTWLGYGAEKKDEKTHNTRWATVLNFRDGVPATAEQYSRGELVTDFLTSDPHLSPMAFAKQLNLINYAGFNLIIGDDKQAVLVNNRGYPPTALHTGLHVISNGQPEDEWYKCERLRTRVYQEILPVIAEGLSQDISNGNSKLTAEWQKIAFEVLSDTKQAPENKLPKTNITRVRDKKVA